MFVVSRYEVNMCGKGSRKVREWDGGRAHERCCKLKQQVQPDQAVSNSLTEMGCQKEQQRTHVGPDLRPGNCACVLTCVITCVIHVSKPDCCASVCVISPHCYS